MAHCAIDKSLRTDLFEIVKLDHLEWYVGDALSATKVLKTGLGMELVAESKKETGNHQYSSYVLQIREVKFVVTAPYLAEFKHPDNRMPNPKFSAEQANLFFKRHGNGVRAVGVEVKDAVEAYKVSTSKGAKGIVEPTVLKPPKKKVEELSFRKSCSTMKKIQMPQTKKVTQSCDSFNTTILRDLSFQDIEP